MWTELDLQAKKDWDSKFAALLESVASKPAPFKNRRDAAPENSTVFISVAQKGLRYAIGEI
jgi:hypothetical protein